MNIAAEDHGHVGNICLIEPKRRGPACPYRLLRVEHHPTAEIVTVRKVSIFDECEVDPSAVVRCSGGTCTVPEVFRLCGTVTTHSLTDVHEGFVDFSGAVEIFSGERMMKLHEPVQVLFAPCRRRVILMDRPIRWSAGDRAIELRGLERHLVDPLVVHRYSAQPRVRVSALNVDHQITRT